jgi:Flp pilus assembly protein TadG
MASEAPVTRRAMFARLLRDRDGFVIAMVALLLPVLIGFAGLAAETGLWYAIKRQNQSAADEAAISGAMEVVAGKPGNVTTLATRDAVRNGFINTAPNTITVTYPYSDTSVSNGVEVVLSQQQNSLFASLFLPNVTINTRAVATALSSPACLLALGTSGTDLTVSGGSAINMPNCSAVTNSGDSSSVSVTGGAALTAQTIITSGNISPTTCAANPSQPPCTLTIAAKTAAAATPDPYASRVTSISLPPLASCANDPMVSGTVAPPPAPTPPCYKGITFKNPANVTLAAGVYFVNNGNLTIQGGTVRGSGVTFVVYGNGQIQIQNSTPAPVVALTAPTSGGVPYQGLLFYQPSADTHDAAFQGCSTGPPSSCTLTGAIYVPAAKLTFSGNSTSSCTVLIANTIVFSGSSTLNASQCGAGGVTTPSSLTGAVALAE